MITLQYIPVMADEETTPYETFAEFTDWKAAAIGLAKLINDERIDDANNLWRFIEDDLPSGTGITLIGEPFAIDNNDITDPIPLKDYASTIYVVLNLSGDELHVMNKQTQETIYHVDSDVGTGANAEQWFADSNQSLSFGWADSHGIWDLSLYKYDDEAGNWRVTLFACDAETANRMMNQSCPIDLTIIP